MRTRDFLLNIVIALISVLGTYFMTINLYNNNNKLRYIDVFSDTKNSFIGKPSYLDKKLTILLDNNPIDNFCQKTIKLYNFSDVDYDNLNIVIELFHSNGDSVVVFDTLTYGEDKLMDMISVNPKTYPSLNKGGFKINYLISTANRDEKLEPFLTANFLTFGDTPPDFKVHILNKGIEVRELTWASYYKLKWYERDTFIGIVALIIYGAILYLIVRYGKIKRDRRRKKTVTYIENKLKNNTIDVTEDNYEKKVAIDTEYYRELYIYETSPKWEKMVFHRNKPPEKVE